MEERKGKSRGRKMPNQKTLKKTILSFLIILILIAAMVMVLFRSILLQNLNQFNEQQQLNLLQTGAANVEGEIRKIHGLVEQFNLYTDLNPVKMSRNPYDLYLGQEQLRRLSRTNTAIDEFVMISGRYDFAVSDMTSYRMDIFKQKFTSDVLTDCENYMDMYHTLQNKRIFKLQVRGEEKLAIVFPVHGLALPSSCLVIAIVSPQWLFRVFTEPLSDPEKMKGALYLEDELLTTQDMEGSIPTWEELGQQLSLGNLEYEVLTLESQNEPFRYAYMIDHAFYESTVMKATMQFLLWLLGIFVVGTACMMVFSYYSYKPILNLQRRLEEYFQKGSQDGQNDVRYITQGVDQLIEENIRLNNQVNVDSRMLRNFCLFKLLHNPTFHEESVRRNLASAGIQLERELFQCISVSLTDTADVEKFASRIEEERESQSPYYVLYYLMNGSSFVLIFNFNEEDSKIMDYMLQNFSQFYVREISMTMGLGSVVAGLGNLQKSYSQSQMALHYAETSNELKLSSYSEMQLNENIEKLYNSRQVELLLKAIQKDDHKTIARELEKLKEYIQVSRMPRYAIKALYYQIVNEILSRSNNPVLFEKGNQILMDIGNNLQKCSLEKLYTEIEALIYQMVDQTSGVLLLDKILDYITQHYADANFSISNMAEEFEMSHQSMTNLFKQEMHVTIIEYVTKYKISSAADMLTHTNLPVSEIVKRVGYIDNSSFSRKFKTVMGMTPAEYRRNFRVSEKKDG